MKAAMIAATLAAIATGVAALPAPIAIAPGSISILRRADQVQAEQQAPQDAQKQQDAQSQQQAATAQDAQTQQQQQAPQDVQSQQQQQAPQDAQKQQDTQSVQQVDAKQYGCYDYTYRSYYQCNQPRPNYNYNNNFPIPYNDGSRLCYAYGQYFPCNRQGGYLTNYPNTGPAPYYGPNTNWRDTTYGSGYQINYGRPSYLGAQGIDEQGRTLPGTPHCNPDGTCVAK
ncbi:hypothetical protein Slin15195_G038940 [Septoria linicola]|uniref:Uncharacterized protein n=1 Tax=Septoria linicola TaxID=215465 RepID=A0A9Q9AQ86_9PEZI|nr:hypothetical protein Slin14017_G120350 [Septoria linicola]USW50575.1 hypothetical protein Slin15195_G038940 [Septoria linicola]